MRFRRLAIFKSRVTGLVGWLLLIILVGGSVPGEVGHTLVAISLAVIPFLGVYAVSQNRRYMTVGIILGLPVIVAVAAWIVTGSVSHARQPSTPLMLSLLVYYGATTYMILRHLFRQDSVDFDTLMGAAAVYLLAGFTFAIAYTAVNISFGPAFVIPPADSVFDLATSIYFSFVTLTTLGYGDIQPVHPMARSLSIVEAICGVLYLAIIISRMVSLYQGEGEEKAG